MTNLLTKDQLSKNQMVETMTSLHKSLVLILKSQIFSDSVRDLLIIHIISIEENLAAEGIEL